MADLRDVLNDLRKAIREFAGGNRPSGGFGAGAGTAASLFGSASIPVLKALFPAFSKFTREIVLATRALQGSNRSHTAKMTPAERATITAANKAAQQAARDERATIAASKAKVRQALQDEKAIAASSRQKVKQATEAARKAGGNAGVSFRTLGATHQQLQQAQKAEHRARRQETRAAADVARQKRNVFDANYILQTDLMRPKPDSIDIRQSRRRLKVALGSQRKARHRFQKARAASQAATARTANAASNVASAGTGFQRARQAARSAGRAAVSARNAAKAAVTQAGGRTNAVRQAARQAVARAGAATNTAKGTATSVAAKVQAAVARRAAAGAGGGGSLLSLGKAAGGVGLFIAGIVAAIAALKNFANTTNESNRHLAMYNGTIAHAFGRLQMGEFRRNFNMASNTQDSAAALADAVNAMRDNSQVVNIQFAKINNQIAIWAANTVGAIFKIGGDLINEFREFFGMDPIVPDNNQPNGWGGWGDFVGEIRKGVLPPLGGNPVFFGRGPGMQQGPFPAFGGGRGNGRGGKGGP